MRERRGGAPPASPPPARPGARPRAAGDALGAACLGAVALLLSGCWLERRPEPTPEEAQLALRSAVAAMLEESAAAWNRGDIEGFIDDYLESPLTTYIGGSGLIVGFDSIRARFAPAFEPGVERGRLSFEDLRVRRLGAEHALATARFALTREDRVVSSGPFTLVLHRLGESWRIIHDHTSSDPPADVGASDTARAQ